MRLLSYRDGLARSLWRVLCITVCVLAVAVVAEGVPPTGSVRGIVTDQASGEPIPWVDVHILDGPHLDFTDDAGRFEIREAVAGSHSLRFSRIGYEVLIHDVNVVAGDTLAVDVVLISTPIPLEETLVVGRHLRLDIEESNRAIELRGRELASKLGATVSATLSEEPGVAERTMGPSPARPVLRGMSGERLLVLEDGVSTGDLSSTSPDHAVVIDPLSAQQVEVVRGPAALAYGSSVFGGVVNVNRGHVPDARLDGVHGRIQVLGESGSLSRATQVEVSAPWEDFVFHGNLSGREGEDVDTPVGEIGNTGIQTWNGSLGLSRFMHWGRLGIAAGYFDTAYGIPGGFLGGHPNGADIEADRRHFVTEAELLPGISAIESVELNGIYTRYFQEELESTGICGVSFGVLNYEASARAHLAPAALGPIGTGSAGVLYRHRDYASACLSFTPPTIERSLGGFLYQHRTTSVWEIGASLRIDQRWVEPARADTNKAGPIRDRQFTGWSGALSVSRSLGPGWNVEATLTRSYRSPALEELFSDGPHLAAFSFEVGNSSLGDESGIGFESALRWVSDGLRATLTGFYNQVDGYIQAVDTGEIEYGAGEGGFLARWQFEGTDAEFVGAEAAFTLERGRFSGTAQGSLVRGEDLDGETPLPLIPPFGGRIEGRYRVGDFLLGAAARGATDQERLGPFETPTAAYLAGDVSVEWSRMSPTSLHTVVLRIENLTDAEYRNHLSRIKSILPEEGRNVAFVYRLSF